MTIDLQDVKRMDDEGVLISRTTRRIVLERAILLQEAVNTACRDLKAGTRKESVLAYLETLKTTEDD